MGGLLIDLTPSEKSGTGVHKQDGSRIEAGGMLLLKTQYGGSPPL